MAVIIDDIILGIGTYLAYEGVVWGIDKFRHWHRGKKHKDILVHIDLTEDDKQLIDKCREVMGQNFPEGIENRLKGMSSSERMQLFRDLVKELSRVYGVEIADVAFLNNNEIGPGVYGYFDQTNNNIRFNVDLLNMDEPEILRAMVDTIFHEMRHALQFRAVTDSSCTYGSEEQRQKWALNFVNYIPANVDFAYYQQQIIEDDARQFAAEVIKGF